MATQREFSWRTASLRALVVSVILAAVLGIAAILSGSFGQLQLKVLLSTLTVGVMSVLGLACGSALDRRPKDPVARSGIILSLISALMVFPIIWGVHPDELYVDSMFTVVTFAVAATHLCLLWIVELDPRHRWSQIGASIAISAAVLLLLLVYWADLEGTAMWRALGVIAIADAAFTLMVPIFHRMRAAAPEPAERLEQIEAELLRLREQQAELERERDELRRGLDVGMR
jgi:drug/metabolite transporter (DMT)-like permease